MSELSRFVLVTGLSGAGKTQTLRVLEDLGFFCVDNLPPALVPTLVDLANLPGHPKRRLAVCIDARSGSELAMLPAYLDEAIEHGDQADVVFLDCSSKVLLQRYSETRRRHPNALDGDVEEGVRRERHLLEPMRARASLIIDTSNTSPSELRERVSFMFQSQHERRELLVTVLSFGFKFGIPHEADIVMDVRFLPNPHYDNDLRPLTGIEPTVRDYVLNNAAADEFIEKFQNLLAFLLPRYAAEPKAYLTIAIGCTGGRHRSVAVAQKITTLLRDMEVDVRIRHRDMERV